MPDPQAGGCFFGRFRLQRLVDQILAHENPIANHNNKYTNNTRIYIPFVSP